MNSLISSENSFALRIRAHFGCWPILELTMWTWVLSCSWRSYFRTLWFSCHIRNFADVGAGSALQCPWLFITYLALTIHLGAIKSFVAHNTLFFHSIIICCIWSHISWGFLSRMGRCRFRICSFCLGISVFHVAWALVVLAIFIIFNVNRVLFAPATLVVVAFPFKLFVILLFSLWLLPLLLVISVILILSLLVVVVIHLLVCILSSLLIISLNAICCHRVLLLSVVVSRLLNSSLYINISLVFGCAVHTLALYIQHIHTSLTVKFSLRVSWFLLEILILHLLLSASVVSVHLAASHSAATGVCLGFNFRCTPLSRSSILRPRCIVIVLWSKLRWGIWIVDLFLNWLVFCFVIVIVILLFVRCSLFILS